MEKRTDLLILTIIWGTIAIISYLLIPTFYLFGEVFRNVLLKFLLAGYLVSIIWVFVIHPIYTSYRKKTGDDKTKEPFEHH